VAYEDGYGYEGGLVEWYRWFDEKRTHVPAHVGFVEPMGSIDHAGRANMTKQALRYGKCPGFPVDTTYVHLIELMPRKLSERANETYG
jgi:hypothetical protein